MSPTAKIPSLLVWKFSVLTKIFFSSNSTSQSRIGPNCLLRPKKKRASSQFIDSISLDSKCIKSTPLNFSSPLIDLITYGIFNSIFPDLTNSLICDSVCFAPLNSSRR